MYKAIYKCSTEDPGLLSFEVGNVFNLIEQIDEHWWSMLSESGYFGLVPASYLEVNTVS